MEHSELALGEVHNTCPDARLAPGQEIIGGSTCAPLTAKPDSVAALQPDDEGETRRVPVWIVGAVRGIGSGGRI